MSEANDVKGLVMPKFMSEPQEHTVIRTGKKEHSYSMPEKGSEIVEAVQWMMTVYDDVKCEYGSEYDCPYCQLVGTVREA